jgi:signal transduction histidine kinase
MLKRLRPAHWIAIDCAATVAMVLLTTVFWRELAGMHGLRTVDAVIVAVAVLPAALRRRWPRATLALVTVAGAMATARSASPGPAMAVAFVMYVIPLRFPRREALWLLAATLAVTGAGLAEFVNAPYSQPIPDRASLLLESVLLITAAWAIGYAVRQQRAYTTGLQEQAEQRAHEQLAEARRAISEERLQIARELHDVVAHTMSVIAVQAGVANYVVGEHPEEAPRALASIEEASRGALREMRVLLGVLRADADLVPAPGLGDLSELIDRTAEVGVRVDLEVIGDRRPLPAGLDLAAYRVVQEAVTNVIKHAGTDACRVAIAYREHALTLEITDAGPAAESVAEPGPLNGHGIVGMRERVGMYGGEFRAGPLPGHGFQVAAGFPLSGTTEEAR